MRQSVSRGSWMRETPCELRSTRWRAFSRQGRRASYRDRRKIIGCSQNASSRKARSGAFLRVSPRGLVSVWSGVRSSRSAQAHRGFFETDRRHDNVRTQRETSTARLAGVDSGAPTSVCAFRDCPLHILQAHATDARTPRKPRSKELIDGQRRLNRRPTEKPAPFLEGEATNRGEELVDVAPGDRSSIAHRAQTPAKSTVHLIPRSGRLSALFRGRNARIALCEPRLRPFFDRGVFEPLVHVNATFPPSLVTAPRSARS